MALTSLEMAQLAAEAAITRRARDILILDLRGIASFTDFFVICSGTSDTHLQGIQEAILDKLEASGVVPWKREGERQANWLVLDYIDIVVHLFLEEARRYYNLERLWADAPEVPLPEVPESLIIEEADLLEDEWEGEWDDSLWIDFDADEEE